MTRVLLLGAGKIGRMIAKLLTETHDYQVTVGDQDVQALQRMQSKLPVETVPIDAQAPESLRAHFAGHDLVVSALSFRHNAAVAATALQTGLSYFDLTEDVATTRAVRDIATHARPQQIFMPQCGLAPGFISIVAHHLAQSFERVDRIHMRVGALPQFPTGQLKYNLTWSTDGLINEYCNPCEAIQEYEPVELLPLEGREQFSLDGIRYEAFNTSGGLGTLCETWQGRVRELNYKTVRYQGHCQLMQFLVNELRLHQQRDTLRQILENAVPITFQDVVVTFCTVAGWQHGQLVQMSDARKVYAATFGDETWSAIQITTAASICTAIDLHVQGRLPPQGFVRQEAIPFGEFLKNRFGRHFQTDNATRFTTLTTMNPIR